MKNANEIGPAQNRSIPNGNRLTRINSKCRQNKSPENSANYSLPDLSDFLAGFRLTDYGSFRFSTSFTTGGVNDDLASIRAGTGIDLRPDHNRSGGRPNLDPSRRQHG